MDSNPSRISSAVRSDGRENTPDTFSLFNFRHKVFTMLRREGKIDEALIKKLLGWRHSGFSIHHQVRIAGHDPDGREKLAQYILRAPFSQQKMRYHA